MKIKKQTISKSSQIYFFLLIYTLFFFINSSYSQAIIEVSALEVKKNTNNILNSPKSFLDKINEINKQLNLKDQLNKEKIDNLKKEKINLLKKGAELFPNNSEILFKYSYLLSMTGDKVKAIKMIKKCKELDFKDKSSLYLRMGRLYSRNKEWLNSYNSYYKYVKKYEENNKSYKLKNKLNYYALTNMGKSLSNLERNEEAKIWIDKALKLNPKYCFGLQYSAILEMKKSNYLKALKIIKKTIKISPNDKYFRFIYGLALLGARKNRKAKIQYRLLRGKDIILSAILNGAIKACKKNVDESLIRKTILDLLK